MTNYDEPVLILESGLDLKHFSALLEGDNILPTYINSEEIFIANCKENKYSAIIISVTDPAEFNIELFKAISWSSNIFTPVIIASPSNNKEFFEQILKQKFEYINFPINGEELLFRLRRMIRMKQNEQAVHMNLLKYKTLLERVPVGILQTDQHGNITYVNPSFVECLQMNEKEVVKENFFQLCHPDDYFIERKQLDRLLRKESDRVTFEIRLINNDGKTTVCKLIASAIWVDSDNFSHFTFILEKID